jgi:hypothetical protein
MKRTIILRAHSETRRRRRGRVPGNPKNPPKWPPYALVVDCETRIDERQSLTFGFFRLLRNVDGVYGEVREEGAFYDPEELKP